MKKVKAMAKTRAAVALALVAAAVSGCAEFGGPREIRWIDPPADGYYTGTAPQFAQRRNPDSQGRKFRVAFLQAFPKTCTYVQEGLYIGSRRPGVRLEEGNLREIVEKKLQGTAFHVMPFREQARDSEAHAYYLNGSPGLYRAAQKTGLSLYSGDEGLIGQFLMNADDPTMLNSIAGPVDRAFLSGWPSAAWTRRLNAELEMRYPEVFSSDASAFPLDVWIVVAFDRTGQERVRSLYEAWLLGLPEHATITFQDTLKPGAIFRAEQAYTDPYDAIAAAVFKLTAQQLENLDPANPNDHVTDGEE